MRAVAAGDFVRVPAGMRHGYRNLSGAPVEMVVTFVPGGFEALFLEYRTDTDVPSSVPGLWRMRRSCSRRRSNSRVGTG